MQNATHNPTSMVVEYVSVWDEGAVTTHAVLDLSTGEVTDIEASDDGQDYEHLQYEEIRDVSRGVSAIVAPNDNGQYFLVDLSMLTQFGGTDIANEERQLSNFIDQGALAEIAFAEYEFGDGVMVTDTSGWEYTTPGLERTRKVYVETEREDDGPAPKWVLNFTVRFDPASSALFEAYAMDEKGQIWGNMASQREVSVVEMKRLDLVREPKITPMVRASLGSMMYALMARRLVRHHFKQRKNPHARRACRDWIGICRVSRYLRITIIA